MSSSSETKVVALPFQLLTVGAGVQLTLTGRLGVQQARPLWDALLPAMEAGQSIQLHAEALDAMDTSIIQILCRLSRETGGLQIASTSDPFMAALKRRGLDTFFTQSPIVDESRPEIPAPASLTESSDGEKPHG